MKVPRVTDRGSDVGHNSITNSNIVFSDTFVPGMFDLFVFQLQILET